MSASPLTREVTVCLQSVVRNQMAAIESLERQLRFASSNNTALQRQQAQLMESVHTLIHMVTTATGLSLHLCEDTQHRYGVKPSRTNTIVY